MLYRHATEPVHQDVNHSGKRGGVEHVLGMESCMCMLCKASVILMRLSCMSKHEKVVRLGHTGSCGPATIRGSYNYVFASSVSGKCPAN